MVLFLFHVNSWHYFCFTSNRVQGIDIGYMYAYKLTDAMNANVLNADMSD